MIYIIIPLNDLDIPFEGAKNTFLQNSGMAGRIVFIFVYSSQKLDNIGTCLSYSEKEIPQSECLSGLKSKQTELWEIGLPR